MATIVSRLPAALLKGDKLIAQVDEGHGVILAAQFEPEETAIECQCLIDIPHLQCDVVEAHDARPCEFSHQNLLCQFRWVRPARDAIAMTVVYRNAAAAGFILKPLGTFGRAACTSLIGVFREELTRVHRIVAERRWRMISGIFDLLRPSGPRSPQGFCVRQCEDPKK